MGFRNQGMVKLGHRLALAQAAHSGGGPRQAMTARYGPMEGSSSYLDKGRRNWHWVSSARIRIVTRVESRVGEPKSCLFFVPAPPSRGVGREWTLPRSFRICLEDLGLLMQTLPISEPPDTSHRYPGGANAAPSWHRSSADGRRCGFPDSRRSPDHSCRRGRS